MQFGKRGGAQRRACWLGKEPLQSAGSPSLAGSVVSQHNSAPLKHSGLSGRQEPGVNATCEAGESIKTQLACRFEPAHPSAASPPPPPTLLSENVSDACLCGVPTLISATLSTLLNKQLC